MFQLLIDGVSREGSEGATATVVNPASGEAFGKVAYASAEDLDQTLRAAARGLKSWQAVPAWNGGGS
jgi:succinate-semialdehyde dehydrogenase/glutarate-semialdehyde dehydrogenase